MKKQKIKFFAMNKSSKAKTCPNEGHKDTKQEILHKGNFSSINFTGNKIAKARKQNIILIGIFMKMKRSQI